MALSLASCGDEADPLSVALSDSRPASGRAKLILGDALVEAADVGAREAAAIIATSLAPEANGKTEAVILRRLESKRHAVTVIFDGVPDDDSISGLRYDLEIVPNADGWAVESMRESWRCWEDRGHRDFSVAPCS